MVYYTGILYCISLPLPDRLIASLVTTDWWFGNYSSVTPIIRPEMIELWLPCDDELFKAQTPERWQQLVNSGKPLSMPTIRPRTFHLRGSLDSIFHLQKPLAAFSLHTLLSSVKLCVCDAQHRHFLISDDWDRHDHLVPWQTHRHDVRARSLVQVVISLTRTVTGPSSQDLNALVLWHNLCMTLSANIQIFELAAGRAGAGPGQKALSDISEWSQTPAARRACIHAAQTFKILSNRKVSDTIMLNSMTALFTSALVLGLYLYQSPPATQPNVGMGASQPFELLDEVDWTLAGDCGLAESSEDPLMLFEHMHDDAAINFIKFGGPVSIGGAVATSGYESARRVLLDYAHLMDGMGPWKPRTFSKILHIMSNVLEEGISD